MKEVTAEQRSSRLEYSERSRSSLSLSKEPNLNPFRVDISDAPGLLCAIVGSAVRLNGGDGWNRSSRSSSPGP